MSYPTNYLENLATGTVYDLGPSQPRSNVLLDFSMPAVKLSDGRKGYRSKNDPYRIYDANGQVLADLGIDQEATRKAQLAQLQVEDKRAGIASQKAHTAKLLSEIAGQQWLGQLPGMPKPPKDQRYNAQGELEWIPGSAGAAKAAATAAEHRNQARTHAQWIDAALADIDKLIGSEDAKVLEHPGLRGSVGYIDSKVMPFSPAQSDAQALIKGLLSKASVQGLTGLRSAGTAPGSITEREWPIFQNILGTIDPQQSEDLYRQQLRDLRTQLLESKGRVTGALERLYPQQGQPPNAAQLIEEAKAAIAAGKDPAAVRARLQQLGVNGGF